MVKVSKKPKPRFVLSRLTSSTRGFPWRSSGVERDTRPIFHEESLTTYHDGNKLNCTLYHSGPHFSKSSSRRGVPRREFLVRLLSFVISTPGGVHRHQRVLDFPGCPARTPAIPRALQNLANQPPREYRIRFRQSRTRSDRTTRLDGAAVVGSPQIESAQFERAITRDLGDERIVAPSCITASVCVYIRRCSPHLLRHPAPWNCMRIGWSC